MKRSGECSLAKSYKDVTLAFQGDQPKIFTIGYMQKIASVTEFLMTFKK